MNSTQILNSPENQADYIVIYYPEFINQLKPLLDRRRDDGLAVRAVPVDQVYAEFGSSCSQSEALRNFISYALQYWQKPSPRYILLAGSINFIPSFRVKSFYQPEDSVSLDCWLAVNKYEDDNKPDAAIGRLPARNRFEITSIINKIIFFEDHCNMSGYRYDNLNLTDAKDFDDFDDQEKKLVDFTLPPNAKVKKITRNPSSDSYVELWQIPSILNEGSKFFNLYAHGSYDSWLYESFITEKMLDTIKLKNKPFIFTAISCSQRFDNPDKKGIIEKAITMDSGGAVATFASAGVGLSVSGSGVLLKFYNEVYYGDSKTIGETILKIKRASICKSTSNDDIYHRFTLLGDPAMKLPMDFMTDMADMNKPHDAGGNSTGFFSYPNPAGTKNTFDFSVSSGMQDVSIDVYDASGHKVKNVISNTMPAGRYSVDWQPADISDGVYFCKLYVGNDTLTTTLVVKR